jgi:hypothetical protein
VTPPDWPPASGRTSYRGRLSEGLAIGSVPVEGACKTAIGRWPMAEADRGAVARQAAGADGDPLLPGLRRPVRPLLEEVGRASTGSR